MTPFNIFFKLLGITGEEAVAMTRVSYFLKINCL
jgi:hypothetical protein